MTEALTITVLDTATIFSGTDTIYRYDIVAAGIIEGWAVPAVVDQARQMCSIQWPEMDVIIDGDEQVTDMLTKTFIAKGVTSYPVDTLKEHPIPDTAIVDPIIERPTKGRSHRHLYGIRPVHIGLSSVLVGVIVGAWLLVGDLGSSAKIPESIHTSTPSTFREDQVSTPESTNQPPATVVLVGDGFHIEAPYGYSLENNGAISTAIGSDQGFKVHFGVNLLHGVDPALVRSEIHRMIESDPSLTSADSQADQRRETINYVENPGDGSTVDWAVWIDADRQISIGCHSKSESSLIHKAHCRQLRDTFTLDFSS